MARARNIKPAFFDNDELAEIKPLGRLLFIGLWTLADFKGDLEWREKRIKKQLLAYDDCNISELAINLDKSGFIRFYSDGNKTYLNVSNFTKHQNPHKNERDKGSEIPALTESMRQAIDLNKLTINRDKSGLKRNDSTSHPADSLILIPDSPILNPEPLTPITDQSAKANDTQETLADKVATDEDINFAKWFFNKLAELNPKQKKPNFDKWADVVRLIRSVDKKSYQEMSDLFMWVNSDDFWKGNILSPIKLRKHWDMLIIQKEKSPSKRDSSDDWDDDHWHKDLGM